MQETIGVQGVAVESILALYEQDRYLDAYSLAARYGELQKWRGVAERVLAGRIAARLGAFRLSNALHWRAYREHPRDLDAIYYYGFVLSQRVGPARTYEFMRRFGELDQAASPRRADWLIQRAMVFAAMRDFEAAERDSDAAMRMDEPDGWFWLCRSYLYRAQDLYDQAMEAAERSLEVRPSYVAAAQEIAGLMVLRNQVDEAVALLHDSATAGQTPLAWAHLAALYEQQEHHGEALEALDRYEALCPIKTPEMMRWLAWRRAYLLYLNGNVQRSIEASRQARTAWLSRMAGRMEANCDGRRVVLPVTFVRQHNKTCAPATLSAIGRYWSMPAEHLAIADEICYDGTPAYYERRWAEENGYIAREFTVTWANTVALIDRGIPFTFTTAEPTSAHLQSIVGYDSRRRTFLVRDPYDSHLQEFDAELTLERYACSGPRGMAMVPREKAALLEGLELTDEKVWDALNRVRGAVEDHQRDVAQSVVDDMQRVYPGHFLTLWARRSVAYYDSSTVDLLAIADEFIGRFPRDGGSKLLRLSCLRRLGRHTEIRPWLAEICSDAQSDVVFRQEFANEISDDPQSVPKAMELARHVLRRRRGDADAYRTYANLLWIQARRDESLVFYRAAACLEHTGEHHAQSYFIASRSLRRTEESLAFLRQRFERLGRKSGNPAWTLFVSLEDLDRAHEGLQALEQGLAMRPDDPELLLLAAEAHARYGKINLAREMLERAKPVCARLRWLRAAAASARSESRLAECLDYARKALAIDPLAMDMHREVAQRLADLQGPAAAIEHLRAAVDQFPHHHPLRQLLVDWQSSNYAPTWEADVRKLVALHPHDAWASRQLAVNLKRQRRLDEALEQIARAGKLAPREASYYQILGDILMERGEIDAAREAFGNAIKLEADARYAIDRLVELCTDQDSRRAALRLLQGELERQVTFGPGLLVYARSVQQLLPTEEVLGHLRDANRVRPDLWQSWVAQAMYEAQTGQYKQAIALLCAASARFPLVPDVQIELARVCSVSGDMAGELEAWQRAYELSPRWSFIASELAAALEQRGQRDQAIEVLRNAAIRTPLDASIHAGLGDLLWKSGQREHAVEAMQKAVECDPEHDWARGMLRWYGKELGKPEIGIEIARKLTRERPGEARAWLALAIALDDAKNQECLGAVQKAMELAPFLANANDFAAQILTQAGRFDEAIVACRPAAWGEHRPSFLQGREIWVIHERGDTERAIAEMQKLVEAEPRYVWGVRQLVTWLDRMPADERYYAAAQRLVAVSPDDAIAFGHLAAAELERKETGAAIAHLERALQLDARYGWACATLFRIQMDQSKYDKAADALEHLRKYCPGAQMHVYGIELGFVHRDKQRATRCLEQLLTDKDNEFRMCAEIAKHFQKGCALRELRNAAWSAARKPGATAFAGEMVGVAWLQDNRWWGLYFRLLLIRGDAAAHVQAWARFTLSLGQPTRKLAVALVGLIHYRYLRRSVLTFGTYGCALLNVRWNRIAAWWMRDTLERKDVEQWMVYNYMMAQANLGRDRQGRELAARLLTMPQHRLHSSTRAWMAIWECLEDKFDAARGHLDRLKSCDEPEALFLLALAQALLEMHRTPEAERKVGIHDVHARILAAAGKVSASNWEPAIERLYCAAGRQLNRMAGVTMRWPKRRIHT